MNRMLQEFVLQTFPYLVNDTATRVPMVLTGVVDVEVIATHTCHKIQ